MAIRWKVIESTLTGVVDKGDVVDLAENGDELHIYDPPPACEIMATIENPSVRFHLDDPGPTVELRGIAEYGGKVHRAAIWLEAVASQVKQEPLELRLCETGHLFLKPNQLYRFTVDPDCKECVRMAEIARTP